MGSTGVMRIKVVGAVISAAARFPVAETLPIEILHKRVYGGIPLAKGLRMESLHKLVKIRLGDGFMENYHW